MRLEDTERRKETKRSGLVRDRKGVEESHVTLSFGFVTVVALSSGLVIAAASSI